MEYEAIIGLEVHAELATQSKMFCACPVVDLTKAPPNSAVCPVCSAMPGALPVVNRKAVELALRVALALNCHINQESVFARKNYFYPDLPKGYQISQYEHPLAVNGFMDVSENHRSFRIGIRRVHLEEDTGKLTHVSNNGAPPRSLIDLNRAGIPLLEIVTEPDFHSARDVRLFAEHLRSTLRYLGVNSGDMQKGVLRIEPNVSVRQQGTKSMGTRTEIKNLNSFRALERSIDFEIQRQVNRNMLGEPVIQQTLGWNEKDEVVVLQRSKEEAHDYRYFPEPDLPPLSIQPSWIEGIKQKLPELPYARYERFVNQYGLNDNDARILTQDKSVADYFETAILSDTALEPKTITNWITSELFRYLNEANLDIQACPVSPESLAKLVKFVSRGEITQNSARDVLAEMFISGDSAREIIKSRNLKQISDDSLIEQMVAAVILEYPEQVNSYLQGKKTVSKWLFGQVMRTAEGKANPQIVEKVLNKQLSELQDQTVE